MSIGQVFANFTIILILLFGLFVLVTIYLNYKNNYILSLYPKINLCYTDFTKQYIGNFYVSKRNYSNWKNKYKETISKVFEIEEYINSIDEYINKFGTLNSLLKEYVNYFLIKKEYLKDKKRRFVYLLKVEYQRHYMDSKEVNPSLIFPQFLKFSTDIVVE